MVFVTAPFTGMWQAQVLYPTTLNILTLDQQRTFVAHDAAFANGVTVLPSRLLLDPSFDLIDQVKIIAINHQH